MTNKFREFIQKVGSGTHTSDNLTRAEAATATKMMLFSAELLKVNLSVKPNCVFKHTEPPPVFVIFFRTKHLFCLHNG